LYDIEGSSVGITNIFHSPVACDRGNDLDTQPAIVFCKYPEFTSQIEVAQDVDTDRRYRFAIACSHEGEESVASYFVAILLCPLKAFCHDGDNGEMLLILHALADRFHIVSYNAHNAGGINKSGCRMITVYQVCKRLVELFLASEHYVPLSQIGREAITVKFRAGRERTPDIPGIRCTANRTMYQMEGVSNRI
jgi:hypothetical protein